MILTYSQAQDIIETIEDEKYEYTEWETDFIDSITFYKIDKKINLTEPQSDCLNKIYEKATSLKGERF